jgi:NADH:ubiquinone oxidoreductase subunit 4 (subunit M)
MLEVGVIAPLIAIILALGVYPQVILDGTERATANPHPEVSTIR